MNEENSVKKPRFSYTALSTFKTCGLQFAYKYQHRLREDSSALNLGLGNIAHKVKELIGRDLMDGIKPDYERYKASMMDGYTGVDKASGQTETIPGCNELRNQFFEDWIAPDTKSGMTYEQKIQIFFDHLSDDENDTEWTVCGTEIPFEVEYGDVILFGFIDKLSVNGKGELKITDYKTSKKIFEGTDIKTPLQMLVYDIAVRQLYPDTPIVAHTYDFVFLGVTQEGGSPGWMARGEKKLNTLLAQIASCRESDVWKPCPSPLCAWCDYSPTNPKAPKALMNKCPYHSLWTPDDKRYEVAQKWDDKTSEAILKQADAPKTKFWF